MRSTPASSACTTAWRSARRSSYAEAGMTTTAWEETARRGREMYDQQAELARRWFDSQAQIVGDLAGGATGATTAQGGGGTEQAAATAELWRSWMALGGSLGRNLPAFSDATGTAAETLGRLLDPVSLSLVGG